ncbi:MAG: RNA polymerase sigma factor [Planctomycetota bacterium]
MTHADDHLSDSLAADYELHGRALRQLASALVGRDLAGSAEDLSQDVWAAWAQADRRIVEDPRRWMKGTLRRLVLRSARDERHRRDREAMAARLQPDGSHVDGEAAKPWIAAFDRLHAALKSLPPAQRDVVYLRYFEELSPAEIAVRLGLPTTTVESRLKRGMAELRRRLAAERKDWRALLAVPASSLPFRSPHSGAPSVVSKGALLPALMKLKVIAVGAAVLLISFGLWLRITLEHQGAPQAVTRSGQSTMSEATLASPGAKSARTVEPDADPPSIAPPAPVVPGEHFCINVDAADRHGGPLVGAEVWIAPTDGMPNLVGRTDADGHLQVQWNGSTPKVAVDVIVQGTGEVSSGVQRVQLRSGRVFRLTARLGKPTRSIAALGAELGRLEASIDRALSGALPDTPAALQTRWRAPMRYFLRAERDEFGFVSFFSAADVRARRRAQTEEAHSTADEEVARQDFDAYMATFRDSAAPNAGSIVVIATDRLGAPAAGLPVTVDRPAWDSELNRRTRGYSLDSGGRAEIRVPSGESVLTLGDPLRGDSRTFQVEAGGTAHWPIEVDRSGDLLLQLQSEGEVDWTGLPVFVRAAWDDALWVARCYPNESGFLAISGCPSDTVEVHVLGSGDVAPLPIATFEGVGSGVNTPLDLDVARLRTTRIRLAPREMTPDAQRARQILVFGAGQDFGAMVDVKQTPDAIYELLVPARPLRLEVASERSPRVVLDRVEPVPGDTTDLGSVTLPRLYEVDVPTHAEANGAPPTDARFVRTDGAIDVEVARQTIDGEPSITEWLAAGAYRVEWVQGSAPVRVDRLEVAPSRDVMIRRGSTTE